MLRNHPPKSFVDGRKRDYWDLIWSMNFLGLTHQRMGFHSKMDGFLASMVPYTWTWAWLSMGDQQPNGDEHHWGITTQYLRRMTIIPQYLHRWQLEKYWHMNQNRLNLSIKMGFEPMMDEGHRSKLYPPSHEWINARNGKVHSRSVR